MTIVCQYSKFKARESATSTFLFLEYRNGWLIRTASKSFAVYAATATEKQEWMAHINKCIEDLLRKSKFSIKCLSKTIYLLKFLSDYLIHIKLILFHYILENYITLLI